MPDSPTPARQALIDALPATGEVTYSDLYQTLQATGNRKSLAEFHAMRRSGQIATRTERTDNGLVLYVSRAADSAPVAPSGGDA